MPNPLQINTRPLKALLLTCMISLPVSFTVTASAQTQQDFSAFTAAAQQSQLTVQYSPLDQFITAYSVKKGDRRIIAFKEVRQGGIAYLDKYLAYLQNVPVASLSKDDQLAYWLNTRNVLVIKAIAEMPRLSKYDSLRGTGDKPGSLWTKARFTHSGQALSIDDIERNILLANWDSHNIVYGFYQGTKSGPALMASSFSGSSVHSALAENGSGFVNSRSGLKPKGSSATLPAFYSWYYPELINGDEARFRSNIGPLLSARNAKKFSASTRLNPAKFDYRVETYIVRSQSYSSSGSSRGSGGGSGSYGGGS